MKNFKKIAFVCLLIVTFLAGGFLFQKHFSSFEGPALLSSIGLGGTGIKIGDTRVGGSYDSQTGRVGVNLSTEDGGEYSAPGCGSDNCMTTISADNYHGIAKQTSIRESILTWTNFFLGFLSLVAMVAIIYAGFLYVGNAGDEEQVSKAKNIVIWAIIGIILIFVAYPLVNTLIETGPSGSDLPVVQNSVN